MRRCVLAQQPEYLHSSCYSHSCGELDQRALLAVAVALLATGVETQGRHQPALVKFTWDGDMPYSGVEWGLVFQVRAICLHRERGYAPQVPVEGLPVPGDFHGRWY